jgi:CRISPR-associated endonuclease/helicase Cas3
MLYAHYDKLKNEKQPLHQHLKKVANLMTGELEFVEFPGVSQDALKHILFYQGEYHDAGKGMKFFQDYLVRGKDSSYKNHSLISAVIFKYKSCIEDEYLQYLAFLTIAKHHSAMDTVLLPSGQGCAILPKQYQDWYKNIKIHDPEIIAELDTTLDLEDLEVFLGIKWDLISREKSDKWFFMLQYLFSKLIWADKMDSAQINPAKLFLYPSLIDIEHYLTLKSKGIVNEINKKREKIRNTVLHRLANCDDSYLKTNRIFTITAPTGTGKTITGISAAVYLAERLEKIYGAKPRIITALPFVNILEQTKNDYENLFQDVLTHYSLNEIEEKGDMPLKDKYLLTNSWENCVIITTFVQLFESVFTSKNKSLLKLNKLAGSIVILDEIQALPDKYYPLIGAALKRISDYYGTRFLLMTATQPEIITFAQKFIPEKIAVTELLENHQTYFEIMSRTQIIPQFKSKIDTNQIAELIDMTRKPDESALIVVNTIRRSIELFQLLKKRYPEEIILYLSTNLIGVDRKNVIKKAKDLIKEGKSFIMVSTQTIEAGVDLDFHVGYRDLAPLESIIQIAGRINRNGLKGNHAPLYVFQTGDAQLIYKVFNLDHTKKALDKTYYEHEYKSLIEKYYKIIMEYGAFDTTIYEEGILKLDYEEIDKFQLIESQGLATVIIEKDPEVKDIITNICDIYRAGLTGFEEKAKLKNEFRKLGKYTLQLRPKKLINHMPTEFKTLYYLDLNFFIVQKEIIESYYNETGYIFDINEKDAIFL